MSRKKRASESIIAGIVISVRCAAMTGVGSASIASPINAAKNQKSKNHKKLHIIFAYHKIISYVFTGIFSRC
jgi:sulfite exporter TauE/SafE